MKCYHFGMLTRKAVTRVCERQGKYFFKSCGSLKMVFFQLKEMLCKDCFMKEIAEQELQLSLLRMNYMNVESSAMFIA